MRVSIVLQQAPHFVVEKVDPIYISLGLLVLGAKSCHRFEKSWARNAALFANDQHSAKWATMFGVFDVKFLEEAT